MSEGIAGLAGSYKPVKPSDWTDPPPTTIADALDRIASALASMSGGFTVIGTGQNQTVGAFGSALFGPFTVPAGKCAALQVEALDLDVGFRATWGGAADGELTYQQTSNNPGEFMFRAENTSGGDKHLNFRVIAFD